jgi:hypothetical protein
VSGPSRMSVAGGLSLSWRLILAVVPSAVQGSPLAEYRWVVAGFEIGPPLASRARTFRAMTILRERQVWKRPVAAGPRRERARLGSLTTDEQNNVRAVMGVLHVRFGSWRAVAEALGTSVKWIEKLMRVVGEPPAGLAIHAARLAGVPVDDVLSGAFPKPGSCPMCGRCEGSR